MIILAGDVGGTNSRLAAFTADDGGLRPLVEATFPSREHGSFDEIVTAFVAGHGLRIERAGIGIAGPVRHGRVAVTNLPWIVDAAQLARELHLPTVALINDLEANAYGIAALQHDDVTVVNAGAPDAAGNVAVIAAGTGLGEAGLFWDGTQYHVSPSEGGHADFAPANELQDELLRYLRREHEHVSCERVLSGPGLHSIFCFLRDAQRGDVPPWLADQLAKENPSSAITRAALEGTSALCAQALDVFVAIYGAEAGNLALKLLATGGIYLGGGIAPRIVQKLNGPTFLNAFLDKGRMRPLLEAVPVRVILNDKTALLGAARCALLQRVP